MDHIAQMVRFHRKKSGLTQKEVADLAHVGKTVVHELESGKITIQLDTLMKIFEVLNIKMSFTSPLMKLYEAEAHEKS